MLLKTQNCEYFECYMEAGFYQIVFQNTMRMFIASIALIENKNLSIQLHISFKHICSFSGAPEIHVTQSETIYRVDKMS